MCVEITSRQGERPMADTVDLKGVLAAQLSDPSTAWSVGTFGAIAEFMRDPGELVVTERTGAAFAAETGRGALRIRPIDGLRLVASESATRESWSQRVALCLPADRCAMNRRGCLTELGPDADAIRVTDRDAILFDLGLDTLQIDACVRVADPDLAERLRTCCGRPLSAPDNPAMGMLLAANPHRVFVSRVGRAEVFQPIPPADGKSPTGPHTHVLPKLLRHRRTHAATEPVPDGFVPCAHFYPAHPLKDAYGVGQPYDARRDSAFQELMHAFGDVALVDLKTCLMAAISAGTDPAAFAVPDDRFARASVRVGLRQLQAAHGPSPALAAWRRLHDGPPRADLEIDDTDNAGH
jgi:hypothetical protein